MKSLMLLNSKKIETIFDLIPRCKKFSKTVRDTIVVNTFTKLLLLRIVSFNNCGAYIGAPHLRAWMKLERSVEKFVKSESFMVESSFQVLVYTWKIVQVETSFQLKTFQLKDLTNCSFQLHITHCAAYSMLHIDKNAFSTC